MDLWHLITNDHANIAALCGDVVRALPGRHARGRDRLFEELHDKVRWHFEAEEDSLYEALEDHDRTKHFIAELEDEHEEIERRLSRLARSRDKGSREWTLEFRTLSGLIEGHFHREEHELFPVAREILQPDELRALRREFVEEKLEELQEARGRWVSNPSTGVLIGTLAGAAAGALAFIAWRSGYLRALTLSRRDRQFVLGYAEVRRRSRNNRANRMRYPAVR